MLLRKKTLLWIQIRIDLAVLLLDSDQYRYRIGNANSEPGAWKVTKITK
jgi:hypothetical protein